MDAVDVKILATDKQVRSALNQLLKEQAEVQRAEILKKVEEDLPSLLYQLTHKLQGEASESINLADLVPRKILMKKWDIKSSTTFLNWEKKGVLKPRYVGDMVVYHVDEANILEERLNKNNYS